MSDDRFAIAKEASAARYLRLLIVVPSRRLERSSADARKAGDAEVSGPGWDAGRATTTGKHYALRSAAAKRSTIAAAGSTAVMAPTLWPAYIAIASGSPSVPAIGRLDA